MKSGPNYRMSKSGKIYLAVNWNRSQKAARRRALIQGELHGSVIQKSRREREN